jgi:hypothetical protein
VNVPLNFDAGELAAGTYNGELNIDSNDPDENPYTVPVTFTVGSFDPPAGLTIYYTALTNELLFEWQSTGAPEYILYSATTEGGPYTTFEGSTSATSLAIPCDALQKQFFVVVSSDGTAASSVPRRQTQVMSR